MAFKYIKNSEEVTLKGKVDDCKNGDFLTAFEEKYSIKDKGSIARIVDKFRTKKEGLGLMSILHFQNFTDLRDKVLTPSPRNFDSIVNTNKGIFDLSCEDKIMRVMQDYFAVTDKEDFIDLFTTFNSLITAGVTSRSGNKLSPKDVLTFRNFDEFKDRVYELRNTMELVPFPEMVELKSRLKKSDVIYTNDDVTVVHVKCYEDSKYLSHDFGRKTGWCISYENSSTYWDDYTGRGLSFIFVLEHSPGDKYALTLANTGGDQEGYDVGDSLTSGFIIVNKYPEIADAIKKSGFPNFKGVDDYETSVCDRFLTIIEKSDGSLGGGSVTIMHTRLYKDGGGIVQEEDGWGQMIETV